VHVTTRPSAGDAVRLRDNGHKVTGVSDLRTGRRMAFTQAGGYLTIKGIRNWDQYDTVFRVRTAGRQGIYPHRLLTATATVSAPEHPAGNLVDGDYLTWWDNDATLPVSITLDLRGRLPVKYLAINQREWSPTHNRETFGRKEDSARIKDYKIYISDDGTNWGEPVKAATLESARGVRFIDLDIPRTRYVRLEVDSTWAAPTVPNFYKKLRIDDMYLGWTTPSGHGH
jgi:alpha-L-fucosidase